MDDHDRLNRIEYRLAKVEGLEWPDQHCGDCKLLHVEEEYHCNFAVDWLGEAQPCTQACRRWEKKEDV